MLISTTDHDELCAGLREIEQKKDATFDGKEDLKAEHEIWRNARTSLEPPRSKA